MASRVTRAASSFFAVGLGALRAPRQDEVADHRGGIADADLDVVGDDGAELGQHRARLGDGARAVGLQLVPVRRQAQDRARIAGAQGADDQVVHRLGVLEHDQLRCRRRS